MVLEKVVVPVPSLTVMLWTPAPVALTAPVKVTLELVVLKIALPPSVTAPV